MATAAWAEVRAHDHVMRYRRAGIGRPVLLLAPTTDADALWPGLADALGAHFRVIVPDLPADTRAPWLADFLEGLGLVGAGIVAAAELCVPALELALRDGDQVSRLVLVTEGGEMEERVKGRIEGAEGRGAVPMLVLRRGMAEGEAVEAVAEFFG